MHGRPREYKEKLKDPAAAAAYAKKVAAIKQGTALVLECRRARRFDAVALKASEKLLRVVPEIYTVWNYRREALGPALDAGGEPARAASDGELALTRACLQENPKSYATWHHRKWVVLKGHADLGEELRLVAGALDLDGRNFHAWAYRQFVVRLSGAPARGELAYAARLIAADFSNYSAWHYRSLLLPRLHCGGGAEGGRDDDGGSGGGTDGGDGGGGAPAVEYATLMASAQGGEQQEQHQQQQLEQSMPADKQQQQPLPPVRGAFAGSAAQRRPVPPHVLDEEYDLVHQAFATDSADQSPWFYYRWLLGNSLAHEAQAAAALAAAERAAASAADAGADSSSSSSAPTSSSGSSGGGKAAAAAAAVEEARRRHGDARAALGEVLAREVARFADALADDGDAKWPLLMTARLKEAQARLGLLPCGADGTAAASAGGGGGGEGGAAAAAAAALREEVAALYARLKGVDPLRAGYYDDAAAGRAFVVVQALGTG